MAQYEKYAITAQRLTGIADAIRAKNGSSDTYTPSEMADAILAIEAGGTGAIIETLDHTVTFKDDQSTVMAVYTVREGVGNIYAPSGFTAKKWVDEDGNVVSFPVNPSVDMMLTADNSTAISELLYSAYGVNPSNYPIILITTQDTLICDFYFCKSIDRYNNGSSIICYAIDYYGYWSIPIQGATPSDISSVASYLASTKPTLNSGYETSCSMRTYRFSHGLAVSDYPLFTEMDG